MSRITARDVAEALRFARKHNKFPSVDINLDADSSNECTDDDTITFKEGHRKLLVLSFDNHDNN